MKWELSAQEFLFLRIDEVQLPKIANGLSEHQRKDSSKKSEEEWNWGCYARGALYALQKKGNCVTKVTSFSCFSFMNLQNYNFKPTQA